MTVETWLTAATDTLIGAGIPSARLDAELLLAHALGTDRTWLHSHHDEELQDAAKQQADRLVSRRSKRVPVAYLTGYKEFYGRKFIVTPDVLIPRPETEVLIDMAKEHALGGRVLDVGTGSGCLGLTLVLETDTNVALSDISNVALSVARKNAKRLGIGRVRYVQSNLLDHWLGRKAPEPFDVIVANLPYVDRSWERSPETDHEPGIALFADDGGLALIRKLIDQAPRLLQPGGHLLLEMDPRQMNEVTAYADGSFNEVDRLGYGLLLKRL